VPTRQPIIPNKYSPATLVAVYKTALQTARTFDAYYNFVKTHGSLRCTPAMAAGVESFRGEVNMKDIQLLQKAIRETRRCNSRHVASVPVVEQFEGQTAWQGLVEVFDLIGHPQAKRAYAWSYRDGDKIKSITILEIPPVDSPQSAVKVAIASKARAK
jgi:hypothetical protein